MKKVVTVTEVEGEGFEALLDKQVLVFCMNYIYTGRLAGVNKTCILLEKASVVYATGAFTSTKFEDAQQLPNALYIQMSSVESFSETNKT
jgi:predicted short-subunit dehydrogenase-like oxidoreductase (DUF2520 family)